MSSPDEQKIRNACQELANFLVEKNKGYGSSIFEPVRIFAKSDTTEQIRVRIDDKLARIIKGAQPTDDTIKDLAGYLVLYLAAKEGVNKP